MSALARCCSIKWASLAIGFFLPIIGAWAEDASATPHFEIKGSMESLDVLPLKASDAYIEIVGTLAHVEVTQTYANVGTIPLEATYVFPGSTRAAVHGLEMKIGDRVVEAVIEKKEKARRVYETAKREGQTASLLEQHRPNVFQMNLANILPGDIIEVTLSYTEWLMHEGGEYSLVYPTVVGPRYEGGGSSQYGMENPYFGESENGAIENSLSVALHAGVAIEELECGTHDVEIAFHDRDSASVKLKGNPYEAGNRDFILKYRVSGDEIKSGLLLSESGGERYFMCAIQPPEQIGSRERLPREYFFVVDVSGSMRGFPLDTAKRMIEALFTRLEEGDRFNMLLFASSSAVFSPEPVEATVENLLAALKFMHANNGGGGTELLQAMQKVYSTPRDKDFSRSIVFLTDGYVTVEEEAFELARERLDEANVFACGIGSSVNRHLIEGLANVGQGEVFFVTRPEDVEAAANRFSEYVGQPILSRVQIQFEGIEVYDVEPPALPDLLAERPIVVFGKWRGEMGGRIKLSGRSGDSDYAQVINVAEGESVAGSRVLEYVWARERVRRLSDYNALWPDGEKAKEVARLGLKHALLTNYTSFVAVDKVVRRSAGEEIETVEQALPLPKGVGASALGPGQAVPVTPEPEMWALIACVSVLFAWLLWKRGRFVGA